MQISVDLLVEKNQIAHVVTTPSRYSEIVVVVSSVLVRHTVLATISPLVAFPTGPKAQGILLSKSYCTIQCRASSP